MMTAVWLLVIAAALVAWLAIWIWILNRID